MSEKVKENKPKTKTVIKNGMEYTLVAVCRNQEGMDEPNFMGNWGYALQSIKKLKKFKK